MSTTTYTPTHSSDSGLTINGLSLGMDGPIADATTSPWKGGTFIIRQPKTKLVIALKKGTLGLFPLEPSQYQYSDASHWHCVENEKMWLGFYNSVSGTYLGHDNHDNFIAEARKHNEWELFCARQHPGGCHVLLVKHWDGFLPMRVGGRTNRDLVIDHQRRGGTAWEFIRIEADF